MTSMLARLVSGGSGLSSSSRSSPSGSRSCRLRPGSSRGPWRGTRRPGISCSSRRSSAAWRCPRWRPASTGWASRSWPIPLLPPVPPKPRLISARPPSAAPRRPRIRSRRRRPASSSRQHCLDPQREQAKKRPGRAPRRSPASAPPALAQLGPQPDRAVIPRDGPWRTGRRRCCSWLGGAAAPPLAPEVCAELAAGPPAPPLIASAPGSRRSTAS